jgi:CRP-like cAMP-binding protein
MTMWLRDIIFWCKRSDLLVATSVCLVSGIRVLLPRFPPQGFNDQCLGCIASHLRLANFARGELVYEHGQRGDEMFLVIEGAVVVHANDRITTGEGKKLPDFMDRHAALSITGDAGCEREETIGERIAAKGDIFGEGGLFPKELGLVRRESATALTWVSTYALSAAAMQEVESEYPEVCIAFV